MRILHKSIVVTAFFVTLLLLLSLLVRIQTFRDLYLSNYYVNIGIKDENNRDYLVAHHLVAYNEYPLKGTDTTWARAITSPAYFYLLAVPLFMRDSFISLGIFNIILQLATVLFVFLLARALFGTGTAFIAAVLFGFNQKILYQSSFVWQPHVMQPFAILSYLLLALGYLKKNFIYLIFSIIFFFSAAALYNPPFALTPFYLFFSFAGIKNLGGTIKHYVVAALVGIVSLSFFYAPLLFYLRAETLGQIKFLLSHFHLSSPIRFLFPTSMSFAKIFLGDAGISILSIYIIFIISITALYYFLGSERNARQKKTMLALSVCIAWNLFAASFLPVRGMPMVRYLAPTLPLAFIFFSEIINSLRNWVLQSAIVFSILYLSTPNLLFLTQNAVRQFRVDGKKFLAIPYQPPPFLAAIKDEILKIKKAEGKDAYNFFGFRMYTREYDNLNNQYARRWAEEIFWNPLEIELRTKLTEVDDSTIRSYRSLSDEQYIFLACLDADQLDVNPCLAAFLRDFPQYKLQKKFWAEPYQMYLVKR